MLNPFGLIILIAAPAIKTTDAFVRLGISERDQEVFGGQQGAYFCRLIYESLPPLPLPPSLFPVPLQIAAEGRGTPPCKPGFSEDTYKVVLPDTVEKGRPLFNGEWRSISACYVCVGACVGGGIRPQRSPLCFTSEGGSEQPRHI